MTGFPSAPAGVEWGDPLPCQWSAVHYSRLALDNGEPYTQCSFTALIEYPDEIVPAGEQVRLLAEGGTEIGQYSVYWDEALDAVSQHRLWLK